MTDIVRNGLLWATAVVTAAFGIALLAAPAQLNELFGGTTNDSVISLSRVFGAVTLGFTVLAVMGRNLAGTDARRAVDASFLAAWSLIVVVSLWNVYSLPAVSGTSLVAVWGSIALYAAFALGFAYVLVGRDMRAPRVVGRPLMK